MFGWGCQAPGGEDVLENIFDGSDVCSLVEI